MSDFHSNPTYGIARKPGRCSWCGESINPRDKQVSQSGMFWGELYRNRYHPECWRASDDLYKSDPSVLIDGYEPHSFTRGCACGSGDKFCDHKNGNIFQESPR